MGLPFSRLIQKLTLILTKATKRVCVCAMMEKADYITWILGEVWSKLLNSSIQLSWMPCRKQKIGQTMKLMYKVVDLLKGNALILEVTQHHLERHTAFPIFKNGSTWFEKWMVVKRINVFILNRDLSTRINTQRLSNNLCIPSVFPIYYYL